MHRLILISFCLLAASLQAQLRPDGATASFKGNLPPKPTAALSEAQEAGIAKELEVVTKEFGAVRKHARAADVEIFLKAVRYALEFDEWYDKKPEDGVKKAMGLLDEAKKRIASLKENKTPWLEGTGQKVVGFYSAIDGSAQPYGVEIPEGLEYGASKNAVPMWIWLHGRGDTATDLHFVYNRLKATKPGQFQPKGTIIIHPFGRYCNGYKSAGETDVLEARDDARRRFNVDENRIALAGFSMGGAGAWHLGAHFADQWACVHAGAGFVDVKRYQKITPEKMPVWYEQELWGVYDVPGYARNFFNVPLIVYSGEQDAQRDAAEYMMEILGKEGLKPPHLIGPGMGHKYHPEVIKEVQAKIEEAVAKGREAMPKKVVLQSQAARYAAMAWVQVLQCEKQWEDTRVEAELVGDTGLKVRTQNVVAFQVDSKLMHLNSREVTIDGQKVELTPAHVSTRSPENIFVRGRNQWTAVEQDRFPTGGFSPVKAGGTAMEDGLLRRFVVVLPDKPSGNAAVDAWVTAESQHFIRRWRSLMRGDPIVRTASEFLERPASPEYLHDGDTTLVLWGTPESNPLIGRLFGAKLPQFHVVEGRFPGEWTPETVRMGAASFSAQTHILCGAYPRGYETPRGGQHWGAVMLNTGLTFREAHDRTNSLQNPKLPDWAILDVTVPPNAEAAGKVVAADFFDEKWQVKK
ncbi:MAG TPA: prolyl oligopeptidase family serine peptidase [Prosthecobacter sp.]|nr:prolyl oligopeptidase family serine peptidase [Prosthecobacter sp.]